MKRWMIRIATGVVILLGIAAIVLAAQHALTERRLAAAWEALPRQPLHDIGTTDTLEILPDNCATCRRGYFR